MKRSGMAVGCSALSGFVIMFHSYDYISLFVPFVNISMSLGSLFQRIASIFDRFYLSRLNKLFEVFRSIPTESIILDKVNTCAPRLVP
jgi:hypothetical protein